VLARFLTGACLAGVYPVGMKIVVGWGLKDRGLLVGLLVGALTLGSASPSLAAYLGGTAWRAAIVAASLLCAFGGLIVLVAQLGPHHARAPRFEPGAIRLAWRDRRIRHAYLGYFGHMWELYAMWAWIGIFLHASFAQTLAPETAATAAKLAAFATVAIGGLGCLAGGLFADRLGRTTLTMLAMAISGTCAATVGLFFAGSPALVTAICLLWGFSIVADSPQFSASVAELSDRFLVGTMLTLQTALGFTLTLVTIHLMPLWIDWLGWRYAFAPLAIGPALGVWAMARLRAHPESTRLAGGRR
jgi:MFS family permease